jgi:hypothetical protein
MAPSFVLMLWGIPLVLMAVSLVYFLSADRTMSFAERLATSSHGAAGAFIYTVAWAIGSSGYSRSEYMAPFVCLFAVPFSLVVASFPYWRGPRMIHLLQLLNLPALFLAFPIGLMAITGDWI